MLSDPVATARKNRRWMASTEGGALVLKSTKCETPARWAVASQYAARRKDPEASVTQN
jgi:hypothetical protein